MGQALALSCCLIALAVATYDRCARAQGAAPSGVSDAVVPVSVELCKDMRARKVMNPGAPIGCDRLRLVKFGHAGFDGQTHSGELVVLDAVADRVLQVFIDLRSRGFPIASAKLMNHYNGDDDASMDANNTSSFNVRTVAGTGRISMHAYGLAIDLNPIHNPYVAHLQERLVVSPQAGAAYLVRKNQRPGMAEAVIDVFADHGFTVWGGYWNSPDYQHFQVSRSIAATLTQLSSGAAQALVERRIAIYRACVGANSNTSDARRACALADTR
jgi:hypothetical protein